MNKPKPTGAPDTAVAALLESYKCPTPFHEVRTRFMGNIASPVMTASPLDTVKGLWAGEWPAFDSLEAVNELVQTLIGGLWNRLTEHQNRRNPFRLLRFDVPQTRDGLTRFALVRRQELDGFIEGLFGAENEIDLPERAHKALDVLAQVRAFLAGAFDLLDDASKAAEEKDLKALLRDIQKLTLVAETEMNQVILSCTRARRELLTSTTPTSKPTAH